LSASSIVAVGVYARGDQYGGVVPVGMMAACENWLSIVVECKELKLVYADPEAIHKDMPA